MIILTFPNWCNFSAGMLCCGFMLFCSSSIQLLDFSWALIKWLTENWNFFRFAKRYLYVNHEMISVKLKKIAYVDGTLTPQNKDTRTNKLSSMTRVTVQQWWDFKLVSMLIIGSFKCPPEITQTQNSVRSQSETPTKTSCQPVACHVIESSYSFILFFRILVLTRFWTASAANVYVDQETVINHVYV